MNIPLTFRPRSLKTVVDRSTIVRHYVALANGRLVRHRRMPNGAQSADTAGDGCMSEEEWQEYCAIIAKG